MEHDKTQIPTIPIPHRYNSPNNIHTPSNIQRLPRELPPADPRHPALAKEIQIPSLNNRLPTVPGHHPTHLHAGHTIQRCPDDRQLWRLHLHRTRYPPLQSSVLRQ